MTKSNAMRIGPKMCNAALYVEANPGCSMLDVARAIGPNGSVQFGYRVVKRAIRAGLIVAIGSAKPQRKYDLYSPDSDMNKEEGI